MGARLTPPRKLPCEVQDLSLCQCLVESYFPNIAATVSMAGLQSASTSVVCDCIRLERKHCKGSKEGEGVKVVYPDVNGNAMHPRSC